MSPPASPVAPTKKRSKGARGSTKDPNDEGPRRVALACVSCRTRKIRCPAQQPECSTCIADGRVCSFVRVTAAENAAARAKKHQSKLAKAARAADGHSDGGSSTSTVKPSPKGKAKALEETESHSQHRQHSTSSSVSSWSLNGAAPEGEVAHGRMGYPLNLPQLSRYPYSVEGPSSNHQDDYPITPIDNLAGPTQPWLLPTPPADDDALPFPATSCAPPESATYALAGFYGLPPAPTMHELASYSMAPTLSQLMVDSHAVPQPSSYLSPPQDVYNLSHRAPSPSSSTYLDHSNGGMYSASEAGSDSSSWSAQLLALPPKNHAHTHLRHASQPNLHSASQGLYNYQQHQLNLPHTAPVHQAPFSLGLYPTSIGAPTSQEGPTFERNQWQPLP